MRPSELQRRSGVLSASKNQHGLTVVCSTHQTALDVASDVGGQVRRDRHWIVTTSTDEPESEDEQAEQEPK